MDKTNITANLIVAIKNSYSNKNKFAYCKINTFVLNILWILYKEGLISDFKVDSQKKKIRIKLKYIKSKPLFTEIKLISKPQLQHYLKCTNFKQFNKKYDYFFVSTSTGVVSSKIILNDIKIGGKILFGLNLNS